MAIFPRRIFESKSWQEKQDQTQLKIQDEKEETQNRVDLKPIVVYS